MVQNEILFRAYARRLGHLKKSVEEIVADGYNGAGQEEEIMNSLLEIEAEAEGIHDCIEVLKHLDRS